MALWAVALPEEVHAQAFLFEDVQPGNYPGSLSVGAGGQTLTLTPEGFPNGSITVVQRAEPLNYGVSANQGSSPQSGHFAPLRFTFTVPVDTITFGFLDAAGEGPGGDIDGSVTIEGFDGSNHLLGTLFYNNPSYDGGTYQTLSGTFGGASYFIASTSSPAGNMNSLVYEIVTSTAIPEPSTIALLVGCWTAFGILARRRSRPAADVAGV